MNARNQMKERRNRVESTGEARPADLLSKREFLKLVLGGTAAGMAAPFLTMGTASASPLIVPGGYLESRVHAYWMKLSYQRGGASRQVRRRIGAGLRNIGAIKGAGTGLQFSELFDEAIKAVFVRWDKTRRKPASLYALIQMLYDEHIAPRGGPEAGRALFGTLLAMVRGRNGSSQGELAHEAYLRYRQAALAYKEVARKKEDQDAVLEARRVRSRLLQEWQEWLLGLVEGHATGKLRLNPEFIVTAEMTRGFHVYTPPFTWTESALIITARRRQVMVEWRGDGVLQRASSPAGPWKDTGRPSPAFFDAREAKVGFFRLKKRRTAP